MADGTGKGWRSYGGCEHDHAEDLHLVTDSGRWIVRVPIAVDGSGRPVEMQTQVLPYDGAPDPAPLPRDPDLELSPGRGGWTVGTISIDEDGLRLSIVTDGRPGGRDYLLLIPLLVDDEGLLEMFGARVVAA